MSRLLRIPSVKRVSRAQMEKELKRVEHTKGANGAVVKGFDGGENLRL